MATTTTAMNGGDDGSCDNCQRPLDGSPPKTRMKVFIPIKIIKVPNTLTGTLRKRNSVPMRVPVRISIVEALAAIFERAPLLIPNPQDKSGIDKNDSRILKTAGDEPLGFCSSCAELLAKVYQSLLNFSSICDEQGRVASFVKSLEEGRNTREEAELDSLVGGNPKKTPKKRRIGMSGDEETFSESSEELGNPVGAQEEICIKTEEGGIEIPQTDETAGKWPKLILKRLETTNKNPTPQKKRRGIGKIPQVEEEGDGISQLVMSSGCGNAGNVENSQNSDDGPVYIKEEDTATDHPNEMDSIEDVDIKHEIYLGGDENESEEKESENGCDRILRSSGQKQSEDVDIQSEEEMDSGNLQINHEVVADVEHAENEGDEGANEGDIPGSGGKKREFNCPHCPKKCNGSIHLRNNLKTHPEHKKGGNSEKAETTNSMKEGEAEPGNKPKRARGRPKGTRKPPTPTAIYKPDWENPKTPLDPDSENSDKDDDDEGESNDDEQSDSGSEYILDKVACEECDFEADSELSLKNHLKDVHEFKDPLECPTCKMEFRRKKDLDRHQKKEHKKDQEKGNCPVCDKMLLKINIKGHLVSVHGQEEDGQAAEGVKKKRGGNFPSQCPHPSCRYFKLQGSLEEHLKSHRVVRIPSHVLPPHLKIPLPKHLEANIKKIQQAARATTSESSE